MYGTIKNNAKSWVNVFGFSIQPSEFAKLIIILYFGIFYGSYYLKPHNKYHFLVPLIYTGLVCVLVGLQPDFGTAAIIAGIGLMTFFVIPFRHNNQVKALKILAGVILISAVIFLTTGLNFLTDEQKSRLNYKAPCSRYTQKTGYQVCNGFIAIIGGGLFGKGIGNSTQKYLYLPEAHTDFIFAIAVEELGVIVGIILILGYMFMLYRILLIAKKATNLRNSVICYGVFSYILIHILINLCGIFAIIPLTGVPLPLLSYGGSSTICVLLSLFLVQRCAIETNKEKELLEIKSI